MSEPFNSFTNIETLLPADEFAFYRSGTGMLNWTPTKLDITVTTASNVGITVKGHASQTANLLEAQNSAGTVLSAIDKDGVILVNTTNTQSSKISILQNSLTALAAGAGSLNNKASFTGTNSSGAGSITGLNNDIDIAINDSSGGEPTYTLKGTNNDVTADFSNQADDAEVFAATLIGLDNNITATGSPTLFAEEWGTVLAGADNLIIDSVNLNSSTLDGYSTTIVGQASSVASSVTSTTVPVTANLTGSKITLSSNIPNGSSSATLIGESVTCTNAIAMTSFTGYKLTNSTTGTSNNFSFNSNRGEHHIETGLAGLKGYVVKAATSQTANLFEAQDSSATVLTVIDAAGKIGVGTASPAQAVDVNGAVGILSGATVIGKMFNSSGVLAVQGDGSRDVSLGSASFPNALFVEGSNGNVGIGTTSPGAKLDVDGTVRFQDFGSGSITGTATFSLAVDSDGDVIEQPLTSLLYSENSVKTTSTLAGSQALDGTHIVPWAAATIGGSDPNISITGGNTLNLEEGTYVINTTVYHTETGGARASPIIRWAVDTAGGTSFTATGPQFTSYLRASSGANEMGSHLTFAVVVGSGNTTTMQLWIGNDATTAATGYILPAGTSSLAVQKVA